MKEQPAVPHRPHPRYLLGAVIAFQLALAGIWVILDQTPPYWDEAWYLYQGAVQYHTLSAHDWEGWLRSLLALDRLRPSLVPTLTVPFFALFGVSDDSGLLVNLVALGMLLVAIYALGTAAAGPRAGLLSAIVLGSYPILIGLVHILLVETVMVLLVALTLLALWRSEGFH
ncbi:MAG: glycosyltransferase family 39 protein, partial [Caldilineaceae bacterium]|nr:glycosyltransferase family 39 protein [Caldilineaceae bacterium]